MFPALQPAALTVAYNCLSIALQPTDAALPID